MSTPLLLHQIYEDHLATHKENVAIRDREHSFSYGELERAVKNFMEQLRSKNYSKGSRVAILLPKSFDFIVSVLAASRLGLVFIPVNPNLKSDQVLQIIKDSNSSALIVSQSKLVILGQDFRDNIGNCETLVVGRQLFLEKSNPVDGEIHSYPTDIVETDLAALFYTSGSTGKPKGVMITHRNLITGAKCVASYLNNHRDDKILAALPFSFDAGFSQITTSLLVGAELILFDFLTGPQLMAALIEYKITGLTAVPPIYMALSSTTIPERATQCLRYFANTGGKLPVPILTTLRQLFPSTKPYLMYGLTEAFRSTYLVPEQVELRPESIGKGIPGEEILVVNARNEICEDYEIGELVHRGRLVSQGYWRNPQKTAFRFRDLSIVKGYENFNEKVVFSGDQVYRDKEGYLFFVGRLDGMIKTSGYRISPEEIEESVYKSKLVQEVVAIGVEDQKLGQRIEIICYANNGANDTKTKRDILNYCREKMPAYMIPHEVYLTSKKLPKNSNGKLDRALLKTANLESQL